MIPGHSFSETSLPISLQPKPINQTLMLQLHFILFAFCMICKWHRHKIRNCNMKLLIIIFCVHVGVYMHEREGEREREGTQFSDCISFPKPNTYTHTHTHTHTQTREKHILLRFSPFLDTQCGVLINSPPKVTNYFELY